MAINPKSAEVLTAEFLFGTPRVDIIRGISLRKCSLKKAPTKFPGPGCANAQAEMSPENFAPLNMSLANRREPMFQREMSPLNDDNSNMRMALRTLRVSHREISPLKDEQ